MQTNEIKINEKKKLIEEKQAWLEEFNPRMMKIRDEGIAANSALKELQTSWDEQKCKIEKNAQAKKIILEEKRVNEIVLTEATAEMNELIHQDKLNDLISKQPNFEDALRSQIEVFANNRLQGLSFGEEETDTKAIGDKIIARMNTLGDFSQPTWIWRDARGDYQEKIKQICDARLKGENITSSFAESRFLKIQNVLRQQETSLFK